MPYPPIVSPLYLLVPFFPTESTFLLFPFHLYQLVPGALKGFKGGPLLLLLGPSCLDAVFLPLLCSSQPTSSSFPEDDFALYFTGELENSVPLVLTLSGFSQRKSSLLLHPGYCFPYLCSGFHSPACSGLFCASWLSPQCLQPPFSTLFLFFWT